MIMRQDMNSQKTFFCMPIAWGLPAVFFGGAIVGLVELIWLWGEGQSAIAPVLGGLIIMALLFVVGTIPNATWRIEILSDRLLCKGILPRQTFTLWYTKCNIGMDYHLQNGRKVWWIYLCNGVPPKYQPKYRGIQINQQPIQPGFVKIMYSEEVYHALLEKLPQNLCSGLVSSFRFTELEK